MEEGVKKQQGGVKPGREGQKEGRDAEKKKGFQKNGGREREWRGSGRLGASFRHNSGGQFCIGLNMCTFDD